MGPRAATGSRVGSMGSARGATSSSSEESYPDVTRTDVKPMLGRGGATRIGFRSPSPAPRHNLPSAATTRSVFTQTPVHKMNAKAMKIRLKSPTFMCPQPLVASSYNEPISTTPSAGSDGTMDGRRRGTVAGGSPKATTSVRMVLVSTRTEATSLRTGMVMRAKCPICASLLAGTLMRVSIPASSVTTSTKNDSTSSLYGTQNATTFCTDCLAGSVIS